MIRPRSALVALVALLPAGWGCGSPTAEEPGGESRPVNEPVEHANGIFEPESCEEPRNSLSLLGRLDLPRPLTDVWGYYDAETDREYALAGFRSGPETGGLYVIDVTDPAAPALAASLEDAAAHDVVTWRHYAYTVTGHSEDGETGVVYDLSDPERPVRVGAFPSGHNLFVDERGYLYEAEPGVRAYDLERDPAAPEPIWDDGRTGGHDVAVIDGTLFDFHGFDGTAVYDAADPFAPDISTALDNDSVRFHHSGWTSASGEYLYINDELPANLSQNPDITIWHLPTGRMVGTFRDPLATVHNSYELCDRLVVSYYTKGVVLFDIGNPEELVLLDEHDTDPDEAGGGIYLGAWGVFPYTRSGAVLVSDVNKGLFVFRLE